MRSLDLSRVEAHTRDFILSLLRPSYGISLEAEQYALLFGAASAATRAITGRFGNMSDVQKTIGDSRLRLSEIGLAEHETLAENLKRAGDAISETFLETGIGQTSDYSVVFAVTKITDTPLCRLGWEIA